MSVSLIRFLIALPWLLLPWACVDPEDVRVRGTNDIIVVDGTITNLAEPQLIKLNRSTADPLTGRFGSKPITKATVEVVVDSTQVIGCHETVDGSYQLPSDFKGQIGHAYQLRFTLNDGVTYESTPQIMPPVPPITKVSATFNPKSLSPQLLGGYTAAHDIFIESQDPVEQHNYYRWEWKLYERQYWCKTCTQGVYTTYKVVPFLYKDRSYFVTGSELYEDCFRPMVGMERFDAPEVPNDYWNYEYRCRAACWEIIYGYDILVFDDRDSNGGLISRQRIAQIPFYDYQPGLVDVRQLSLTADAYRYYKLFQDQTQNTGGLADTPPSALGGNVHQVAQPEVKTVGFFTASAASLEHYWLDRKDIQGIAYGALDPSGAHLQLGDDLFYALNQRRPNPEPSPPYQGGRDAAKVWIWPNTDRPPMAPCLQSDNRTPYKPEGWRE
ncbi:DUF4249 domain-containing protein [Spirosoma lituiforme]